MNDINFPAGTLQPPLFSAGSDDAPNYGNTGGTIGHELTHGFDDEGRQFDAQGNLRDWWTPEDAKQFEQTKRLRATVDPHSPDKYRTNGVVSNTPEFQKAFHCKAGAPMVRENRCRVW